MAPIQLMLGQALENRPRKKDVEEELKANAALLRDAKKAWDTETQRRAVEDAADADIAAKSPAAGEPEPDPAPKLAKDEAMIEEQRPGVMQNFALWQGSDGHAMKNRLHYSSGALRTALTDKNVSDYTRPLPQLVHAVKVAYGFRLR